MHIVWFKRDLRVVDHRPLAEAARRGPVLALYIAEPGYWRLPDTSGRQWLALSEGLEELAREFRRRYRAELCLRVGEAVDVLRELSESPGFEGLWSHEETGNLWTYARDRAVAHWCRSRGIAWTQYPQFGVFRALANRDHWAGRRDALMAEKLTPEPRDIAAINLGPFLLPEPSELGLDPDPCPGRQKGGRAQGLVDFASFLDGRGERYPYEMSSPLTAATACSRLSLRLATGGVSLREIVQGVQRKREELNEQPPAARSLSLRSLDAFGSRLYWHCHFIQKLESEPALETRSAHPLHERERRATPHRADLLDAWISGQTGLPFIDACMRSLIATGWINFRMRAMLMCVASYHLALDWTKSGAALARLFTDYEPGIHWPQTQMQSGQTGINVPRIYNPVKQSRDQDPNGVFIRRWVPELAHLPDAFLHEPWRLSRAEQAALGLRLDADYPMRVIDPEIAAREARGRLQKVRALEGYRPEGKKVFIQHGSRKKVAARARRPGPARQLSFDF